MSKTVLTVLREARELITPPGSWTQQAYARGEDGTPYNPNDLRAVCWCADAALTKVADTWQAKSDAALALRERCNDLFGTVNFVKINDEIGHEAVLGMFDAAIASAEKEARS